MADPWLDYAARKYAEGGWVGPARAAGRGALFSSGDEIEAAVRAAYEGDLSRYRAEHERINREMDAYSEAHPIADMSAEMAGAILPSLVLHKPTAALATSGTKLASRLASLAARPKLAAVIGGALPEAIMGGVYGVGAAKNTQDIPASILSEALPAAGMYGGMETLGHGAKKLWNWYRRGK